MEQLILEVRLSYVEQSLKTIILTMNFKKRYFIVTRWRFLRRWLVGSWPLGNKSNLFWKKIKFFRLAEEITRRARDIYHCRFIHVTCVNAYAEKIFKKLNFSKLNELDYAEFKETVYLDPIHKSAALYVKQIK